jgi:hypothetical protein
MGDITQNMTLLLNKQHEVVNWIQWAQGSVQRVEIVDILQKIRVP